jgi:hypothetical protein
MGMESIDYGTCEPIPAGLTPEQDPEQEMRRSRVLGLENESPDLFVCCEEAADRR